MKLKPRRSSVIVCFAVVLSSFYFMGLLTVNVESGDIARVHVDKMPFIPNDRNKGLSKKVIERIPFPRAIVQELREKKSVFVKKSVIDEGSSIFKERTNGQKVLLQGRHDLKTELRYMQEDNLENLKRMERSAINADQNDIQANKDKQIDNNLKHQNLVHDTTNGFKRVAALTQKVDHVVKVPQTVLPDPINNETETEFYKLRKTRVNAFDFKYLATGNKVCKPDEDVLLVLLCLTKYYDLDTRETIRTTWGSVASTERWAGQYDSIKGIKLVFLLGHHGDSKVKRAILEDEASRFNDVVAAGFVDSYHNLTYKVMLGLKWTLDFCKQARYVVKIDQDVFLNVHNLVAYLNSNPLVNNDGVLGYSNTSPKVLRTGKWGVSWEVFPFTAFPNYTNGNCYVISNKAVSKILEAAERLPVLQIEDAFLTGVCRHAMNISITHHTGFTRWGDPPPRLCGFHNTYRIAATNADDNRKRDLWRALQYRNVKNCYNVTSRRDMARKH